MLLLKKKYNKLKEDYNHLVDTKNYWEEAYRESQSKAVRLEKQCNRLYKELDKVDDEVLDLKFERDTYKEKYEEYWQKFIKTRGELKRTDKVVLQYENRINELEELSNETTI